MRNLFAISKILSEKGMNVIKAEDGKKAMAILEKEPDIDLVLLDIMMPVMDGYETAKAIRAQPRFHHLPIITLTAKAMKDDRDKCIAAGASDYLSKPVEVDRLLSMLRVWLYKRSGY
jgi:CheY-like chemotaxis protein